jgi:hypothetical protein
MEIKPVSKKPVIWNQEKLNILAEFCQVATSWSECGHMMGENPELLQVIASKHKIPHPYIKYRGSRKRQR